jgi:hypothetical protein
LLINTLNENSTHILKWENEGQIFLDYLNAYSEFSNSATDARSLVCLFCLCVCHLFPFFCVFFFIFLFNFFPLFCFSFDFSFATFPVIPLFSLATNRFERGKN